jgi:hypothetical protein
MTETEPKITEDFHFHYETADALQVSDSGNRRDDAVWLPSKLIKYTVSPDRFRVTVEMPVWLYHQNFG